MPRHAPSAGWQPTVALLAAVTATVLALALGVLLRHPDLVVVAAPFVVTLGLLNRRRPAGVPGSAALELPEHVTFEGSAVPVGVRVTSAPGADLVQVALVHGGKVAARPPGTSLVTAPPAELVVTLDAERWGRVPIGPINTLEYAGHGLLVRVGPVTPRRELVVLPERGVFDATDAVPQTQSLIGEHRSRAPGSGTDLLGVRPFVTGDRLRRITWPVSLRTGHLHVTVTTADRDAEVALILDSSVDVGSTDVDEGSSLDITVRATAAVADHYVRRGDPVRLVDLASLRPAVRLSGARRQLLSLLVSLVSTSAARLGDAVPGERRLSLIPPRALGIVFSPLLDEQVATRLASLARRGQRVVVIDTLPAAAAPNFPNPVRLLAWRIVLLRREVIRQRLHELGVPVVRWTGPGSLDDALRALSRAAVLPRARA